MTDIYVEEVDADEKTTMRQRIGNGVQTLKQPKKWTRKNKILSVIVVILLGIVVFQVVVPTNIGQEVHTIINEIPTLLVGLRQQLYAEGDGSRGDDSICNRVVFPYSVMLHVEDNSVEKVFESIVDNITESGGSLNGLMVFDEDSEGSLLSWSPAREPQYNDLETIDPYHTYWVYVPIDCMLEITFWDD